MARESHQPLVFPRALEKDEHTDMGMGVTSGGLVVFYSTGTGTPRPAPISVLTLLRLVRT